MTGNIRTMDELFSAWEKEHCSENDTSYLSRNIPAQIFLPDGIINPAEFEHSKPKVLFIAKEANWYQSDNDPTKEIDTMFWHREVAYGRVPRTSFYYRLSMLANAIMHSETDNYSVIDKSHDILKSVAFMNLNKRGGYSYCIDGMSRGTSKFFSFDYCLRASLDAIILSTSTGVIVEISAFLASTVKVVFPILISKILFFIFRYLHVSVVIWCQFKKKWQLATTFLRVLIAVDICIDCWSFAHSVWV